MEGETFDRTLQQLFNFLKFWVTFSENFVLSKANDYGGGGGNFSFPFSRRKSSKKIQDEKLSFKSGI